MTELPEIGTEGLTTLCRICARHSDSMLNLFIAEHEDVKLVDMLVFCLKQMIHEGDGLPGIICDVCGSTLIMVHEFHKLYNDSEQRFHQVLDASENKVKVEMEYESGENVIKQENEGDIFLLPEVCYFDNDHFETSKPRKVDKSDLVTHEFTLKTIQRHEGPKNSKKLIERKKAAKKRKSHETAIWKPRTNPEYYECFQCEKRFKKFKNLQRHSSSHIHKEKPYECTECRIRFVYLKSLFRHRRQKHPTRIYECEYCPDAFLTLIKLKQHLDSSHKYELKTYKCDSCSKKFSLRFQLACHQSEQLCSQQMSCKTCGESFSHHRMLKSHIRDKHTSKLPV